jgi:hypothetical protein
MLKNKFQEIEKAEELNSFDNDVYTCGDEVVNDTTSAPLVIKLTNITASDISNVTFLDAINSIGAPNSGVTANVTPSFLLPGFTYAQFLKDLQSKTYKIGKVIMISENGNTADLLLPYTISTYNMTGKNSSDTVYPVINTLQNVTTQLETAVDFYITPSTKIVLSQITKSCSLTIHFYPTKQGSSLANLANATTKVIPQTSGFTAITVPQTKSMI